MFQSLRAGILDTSIRFLILTRDSGLVGARGWPDRSSLGAWFFQGILEQAMLAVGEGSQIRVRDTMSYSNSIGWVYSRVTDLLGFVSSKEEHKTQWLGLEGEPVYKDIFLRVLRRPGEVFPKLDLRYFRRNLTGGFVPSSFLFDRLGLPSEESEFTTTQKRNLASSVQAAITELISDLLASFQKKTGLQQICLGGGVFHNTLLVASLERKFGVGNIFVPPAPGNAGCALGETAWIWHQQMGKPRNPEVRSVYWGPIFARTEIKDVLDNVKACYSLHYTGEKTLDSAVQLLRAGKIVGWFHGATEFGPRALGNRSILASPWAPYVSENLNDYVKHRESFRPFAVSVREEDCARYFEGSPLCRFMNSLAVVRADADVLPRALQTSRRPGAPSHRRQGNQPFAVGIARAFWRTRTGAHSGEHLVQSSRRAPGRSPKGRGSHLFLLRHRCRLHR